MMSSRFCRCSQSSHEYGRGCRRREGVGSQREPGVDFHIRGKADRPRYGLRFFTPIAEAEVLHGLCGAGFHGASRLGQTLHEGLSRVLLARIATRSWTEDSDSVHGESAGSRDRDPPSRRVEARTWERHENRMGNEQRHISDDFCVIFAIAHCYYRSAGATGHSVGAMVIAAPTGRSHRATGRRESSVFEENASLKEFKKPWRWQALILGVCDETSVAELKIKVGDFQLHLKRNVGATNAPLAVSSPVIVTTDSPEITQSVTSPPVSSITRSSLEKVDPFVNPSIVASSKLAALEANGYIGYKLVSSSTVGSFRKGRTVKGKTQPPICKEASFVC
ncbi:hypothetical protein Dimus_022530 [Dionaea muscipula]